MHTHKIAPPVRHRNSHRGNGLFGEWRSRLMPASFVAGLAVLLLQSACVGSHPQRTAGSLAPDTESTVLPAVITADLAALFTGVSDFTARLQVEPSAKPDARSRPPLVGAFSGQNGSLLFIPEGKGKRRGFPGGRAGGMSFLWSSQSNAAFVLNEPLQGCAPVGPAAGLPRTVVGERRLLGEEPVNGQPGQKWLVTCSAGNTGSNVFTVWCAPAWNNIPVKIQSAAGSPAMTLVLSDVRFRPLSRSLFVVPDGFTHYANEEAMMAEMMQRQSATMKTDRMDDLSGPMSGGRGHRPAP